MTLYNDCNKTTKSTVNHDYMYQWHAVYK